MGVPVLAQDPTLRGDRGAPSDRRAPSSASHGGPGREVRLTQAGRAPIRQRQMGIVSPGFFGRRRSAERRRPPARASTSPRTSRCCRPVRRHASTWTTMRADLDRARGMRHRFEGGRLQSLRAGQTITVDLASPAVDTARPRGPASDRTRCSLDVETSAEFALIRRVDGTPSEPAGRHGGPARLLVPHRYLEEREVGARTLRRDEPGLGDRRLSQRRRPLARAALLGLVSGRRSAQDRPGPEPHWTEMTGLAAPHSPGSMWTSGSPRPTATRRCGRTRSRLPGRRADRDHGRGARRR